MAGEFDKIDQAGFGRRTTANGTARVEWEGGQRRKREGKKKRITDTKARRIKETPNAHQFECQGYFDTRLGGT